jgi:hypothetical protein
MAQTVLAQACRRGGTARRGRGGSPRTGSPWPAAAPDRGAPAPGLDDHAGAGRSTGGAPRPRAATPAAPRPWLLSAGPPAPTIPAAGRSSDRAVVAPSTDHLRHRIPRRTRSSEPTAHFLTPTRRLEETRGKPGREPGLNGRPTAAFPQLKGGVAGTGFEPV